ncbi:MAG: translation initiation factor IF-1 [Planctomycetota bacterium]
MSGPTAFAAVVAESLPNARFLCRAPDGREVLCHVSGEMRLRVVRLLPGDEVTVEPSPYDPGKGRIVARAETARRQES